LVRWKLVAQEEEVAARIEVSAADFGGASSAGKHPSSLLWQVPTTDHRPPTTRTNEIAL
jgi:hypothetical protein